MKKLTLDFNERQEEEEFQDLYGGVSEMRNRKILNIFIEIGALIASSLNRENHNAFL